MNDFEENRFKIKELFRTSEKNGYRLQAILMEASKIQGVTEDFLSSLLTAKLLLNNHPEQKSFVEEMIQDKESLMMFREIKKNLDNLSRVIDGFEDGLLTSEVFLENFRNYLFYPNRDKAMCSKFITGVAKELGAEECLLNPEFVGDFDVAKIASDLDVKHEKRQFLVIPSESINDSLNYFEENFPLKLFFIDCGGLKISMKKDSLVIRGNATKIKQVEKVALKMGLLPLSL
ncbi:MAG: hypothetical protein KAS30_02905 [Candidatus Diapherotrites archaeon]|nr:hypothetical protein [Candidatus Diapherotrites archaeon]